MKEKVKKKWCVEEPPEQRETGLAADRDSKKRRRVAVLQKQCVYNHPTVSTKRKHQEETPEQRKTRLAAQREKARLGVSNLKNFRSIAGNWKRKAPS